MSFSDQAAARFHDHRGDEAEAVDFLKSLAGSGPVLELAIGTGRIALPLAEQGLKVDGIDFSEEMVAQLRSKPGGRDLDVHVADFVDMDVKERYSLIYIVWNSFFNVLSQGDQIRCLQNVATHLADGGHFVIEAFVPSFLHKLDNDQQVQAESIEAGAVRIGVLKHDAATQTIEQSHITLSPDGIRLNPVAQRYAWPSELDLMAQIAGLRLKERWGGWTHEPFESSSSFHISVYGC